MLMDINRRIRQIPQERRPLKTYDIPLVDGVADMVRDLLRHLDAGIRHCRSVSACFYHAPTKD